MCFAYFPLYLVFKLYIYYFRSHAGGRLRHAFIGIGFRERTEAYDFQAALHDHMKYALIYLCAVSIISFAFLFCDCLSSCCFVFSKKMNEYCTNNFKSY